MIEIVLLPTVVGKTHVVFFTLFHFYFHFERIRNIITLEKILGIDFIIEQKIKNK